MFDKYKNLKSIIEKQTFFDELNISQVIAFDLIKVCYNQYKFKPINLLKGFFVFKLPRTIETKNFFSIGVFNNRLDYLEIIEYARSSIGKKNSFLLNFDLLKKTPYFNLKNGTISFKTVVNLPLTLKDKLFLFVNLWFYLNLYSSIKTKKINVEKHISFSSAHPCEVVFISYFKKLRVLNYGLQHGLYYIYKDPVPLDALLYDNICCDIHLAWGQYTLDEFCHYGINKSKIKVAGYPRLIQIENKKQKPDKIKSIIVFLSRSQFDNSNNNVLKILKSCTNNYNIFLKLHPSLDFNFYSSLSESYGFELISKNKTISSLLKENIYDISIAVNTTVYYESYIYNIPCLRYLDDSFYLPEGVFNDIFKKEEELNSLIDYFEKMSTTDFNSIINERLNYLIGLSVNNYEDFI